MKDLPFEIWIKIINYLDNKNLKNLALTNKFFFFVTKEKKSWKYDSKNNIRLLKHYNRINCFEDFHLNFSGLKYYIFTHSKLFRNKLKTINLTASHNYELLLIKYNSNLKNIKLKCCNNITNGYIVNLFLNLKNLKNIYLNSINVKNNFLNIINNYKLNSLSLEACVKLSKLSLIKQRDFKKIELINLFHVPVREIIELIKYQTSLISLNLSASNINFSTVMIISDIGRNLKYLNLSFSLCSIDDLSAYILSFNCKNLVSLNLNNSSITDRGSYYIIKNCSNLKELFLAGSFIRDMTLIYISNYLNSIIRLGIEFNNISRIGVYNILIKCKNIKYLNIMNNYFTVSYLEKVSKTIKNNN